MSRDLFRIRTVDDNYRIQKKYLKFFWKDINVGNKQTPLYLQFDNYSETYKLLKELQIDIENYK